MPIKAYPSINPCFPYPMDLQQHNAYPYPTSSFQSSSSHDLLRWLMKLLLTAYTLMLVMGSQPGSSLGVHTWCPSKPTLPSTHASRTQWIFSNRSSGGSPTIIYLFLFDVGSQPGRSYSLLKRLPANPPNQPTHTQRIFRVCLPILHRHLLS